MRQREDDRQREKGKGSREMDMYRRYREGDRNGNCFIMNV
jgi:hypothetical protein